MEIVKDGIWWFALMHGKYYVFKAVIDDKLESSLIKAHHVMTVGNGTLISLSHSVGCSNPIQFNTLFNAFSIN